LQDVRRFKPSTVSRRLSVVAGFYRTCVIDGVLEHSPADYVRRPTVPPESPTLGLTHLQFEAMLTAARQSSNPFDFALVCLLGLLGLRIFETVGADIDDLGEGARPPGPARARQGRQGRPGPAATRCQPRR
jgi:integrase/recombinase XerD